MSKDILVKGAKNNNLKNISVNIPKNKITVVVGVSGSGKSSLIFDTLAAESQRLMNETYSSYIQQLLPHFDQPNVEQITNLPVSIVIDQKKIGGNIRSTVGTVTDIYTGLRLLFSRIGRPFIGYSMNYSFNNPQGMCQRCQGLGQVNEIDIEALIDFGKSLNEGAIQFPTFQPGGWRLTRYTESGNFNNDKKLSDYSKEEMTLLLYDTGSKPKNPTRKWHKTSTYVGIIERIKKTILEKNSFQYESELKKIIQANECPECKGTRVDKKVCSSKILGKSIADCIDMSILELIDFINQIDDSKVEVVLADLKKRLNSLITVGLGYLTIGRGTSTLSGGESQRIKMTKHLNSALSDVLYIFDEPSVGLHPEDLIGISKIFIELRDKGNTVVLVDHDPDIIKIADHIIELGETAGANGGQIVFEGSYAELLKSDSLTARALMKAHKINPSKTKIGQFYTLENVSAFNVKQVSIKIPEGKMTVVTGVAGSGKSTLIRKLFARKYPQAIVFDQSPIRGSNRSNLLTYLGVFDKVRQIYAKSSHKDVSLFSFNGKGACPECKGKGFIKYDLAYMGDVTQTCERCQGKRYNDEALAVTWQGKNIYEFLQLTVEETYKTIKVPAILKVMKTLIDVNLSYMKLGQSVDTYSGGEIQRLKIAESLLVANKNGSSIFILDEPSTGLHEADIERLLNLLNKILASGKTLIVLEHNLFVIAQADWIIDMGLGGGNLGGKVVFEGYPFDFLQSTKSYTSKHLRRFTNYEI